MGEFITNIFEHVGKIVGIVFILGMNRVPGEKWNAPLAQDLLSYFAVAIVIYALHLYSTRHERKE